MNQPVEVDSTTGTSPRFEFEAEVIMRGLGRRSVAELSTSLKLGPKNAQRLYEEIYDFPNKLTGCRAGEAFTGVVFRALSVATLSADARARYDRDVRIVSSLYGLLRPSDVIKPYRLDFGVKGAPGGKTLAAYWKPLLTESLLRELQERGESEVLNLLPQDAAKCFDWKAVSKVAEVYTATFAQLDPGKVHNGNEQDYQAMLRTPHSDMLKRLRGTLLRHILTDGIKSIAALRSHGQWHEMFYDPAVSSAPGQLTFIQGLIV